MNGPMVDPAHFYGLGAKNKLKNVSGVTQSTRAANWRNQGTMISLIRRQVSMTPSRLEPLWQDTGDRSQPDP
ncbi:hypothetical protein L3X38_025394 [Prunus dulcis]|uniref:Uncharacterized protein n=1 Tax=Prunus dulcis TaxID=3755 RepID=A0AAD4W2E5_PRUDU|nr:hypothetical protein L3X38_025394 [Prunus dulcis]